jgi:hypothetical protein
MARRNGIEGSTNATIFDPLNPLGVPNQLPFLGDERLKLGSLALQVTFNLRIWHQDRGDKSDGAHESDVPIKA